MFLFIFWGPWRDLWLVGGARDLGGVGRGSFGTSKVSHRQISCKSSINIDFLKVNSPNGSLFQSWLTTQGLVGSWSLCRPADGL